MAETPAPNGAISELLRHLAPYTPVVAGSVLSMAFGERLTIRGKILSAVVGVVAALCVAPFLIDCIHLVWPGGRAPTSVATVVGFACGAFGMVVLAGLAQALAKYSRDPLSLVRMKLGPVEFGGPTTTGAGE